MSRRNPTTFNAFIDEATILPGTDIVTTTPSAVVDDQTFVLDQGECVISDMWPGFRSVAAAFEEVTTYAIVGTDICDVSESSTGTALTDEFNYECYYFAWNSDGMTAGEIKLTSTAGSSNTSTKSITTAHTLAAVAWRAFATIHIRTNDDADELLLEVRRTSGAGAIFVAGFAAFSTEL